MTSGDGTDGIKGGDDPKKPNLSSLKITYNPKKGVFKGGFKIYEVQTSGDKRKLKKHSAKMTGLVAEGAGTGNATLKRPAASWKVTVE